MKKYTSRAVGPVDITKLANTRKEAQERGDTYFYTGKPCKNGHVDMRYVSSPICVTCAKSTYLRRKPKTLAELKERYRADPEKYRQKERDWAELHPKRYWAKSAMKNARVRAKKAGLPCTITIDYLVSILPDTCPVFGTSFAYVGNGATCARSASLDRKEPAKGYVPGNVVVISHLANTIKQNASSKTVARVAAWMVEQGL